MTQSIVPYDQTHLLVTHQDSISLLNMNTLEQKSVYEINNTFQISSLFYDNKGEVLWIGTSTDGLFYLDMKKKSLLPFSDFPKQPIGVITESSDSTLLVGIDGQGVW